MDEAWLAALDLHDDIEELAETAYNPYVIPVVSFTDTIRHCDYMINATGTEKEGNVIRTA